MTPPTSSLSVGGAFVGLEDIIERRTGEKKVGFGSQLRSKKEKDIGTILADIQPEDLLKFGLIPEFVGRIPVLATLGELDEASLVEILTKPKNALVKQYQKLFDFEKVKLKFTQGALVAIAKEALKRKSGARGLRAILEHTMLDIMYEIPSQPNVREVFINEDIFTKKGKPLVVYEKKAESA